MPEEKIENDEKMANTQETSESAPVLTKKEKVKKGLSIGFTVVEVIVVVFLLIVSLLSMASTTTNASGVSSNPITGTSLFPVLTDSMSPTFSAGDLVYGKQFKDAEKDPDGRLIELSKLEGDDTKGENQGDIIIYWAKIHGDNVIVTHRIRRVEYVYKDAAKTIISTRTINGEEIPIKCFYTRGDAETWKDEAEKESITLAVSSSDIIGYYQGHVKYVGAIINGLQNNKTVMFFALVFPLIALFIWNGYSFIRIIFINKKETAIEKINTEHEEEKAKLLEEAKRLAMEELRKEMEANKEKDDK